MRKKTEINFSASTLLFFVLGIFALLQVTSFLIPSEFITFNDGFIFGQFGSNIIAIFFLVAALFLGLILIKNNLTNSIRLWLILLLSGLLSNLFERIFYHGVIDYISIGLIPTFNLADLLIVLSISGITGSFLLHKKLSE